MHSEFQSVLQRGQSSPFIRLSEAAGGSKEFWCWTGSPPCNPSVWPPPPLLGAPVALVALNNATVPRVMFASGLWPPGVFTVTVNTAGSCKWSIVTLSRRAGGMWSPRSCSLQPTDVLLFTSSAVMLFESISSGLQLLDVLRWTEWNPAKWFFFLIKAIFRLLKV